MKMKPLTPAIIAEVTGGRFIGPEEFKDRQITGVFRDNREVSDGSLFVCIKGARVDGHDFAAKAAASGAVCCLTEHEVEDGVPCVMVESTLKALREIAAYYRSLFTIPFVGIIGSVGKTTVKEMTAAVLGEKFVTLKTPENLNNEIGVPLTILSLREEHEAAVIEMGISDFGEMSRLSEMVRPDICIMTTIGHCHLENLGDLKGVLSAKSEVFQYMTPDSYAVMNGDDDILRAFMPSVNKITYGTEHPADFSAENIENMGVGGISCDIRTPDSVYSVHIPGFGRHLVSAALAAAAVGRKLGVSDSETASGIGKYGAVGGRSNVEETGYIRIINDCYNANPNSVTAALHSLSGLKGRKVALLGDMKELGRNSAQLHRDMGVLAVKLGIDSIICCGAEAENIYKGIISTGERPEAWHFPLKDALISVLPSLIRTGDNVLVKASHSMHFEELVEELRKLS